MKKRKLGELSVSALGFGCMGLSEFYGNTEHIDGAQVIEAAFDQGITFFDTADMYGSGENEKLLARASHTFRDKITIATKFGIVRNDDNPKARNLNGSSAYVQTSCEESLKRLGIDVIDLYYLHRVDPKTPIEETVTAMAELVKQGKVRYLGLSEVSLDQLKRAHDIHPITAVQTEYSLFTRHVESDGVLDFCKENNIGFVPYSPLSRALLSKDLYSSNSLDSSDFRRDLPRFTGDNFTKNQKIAARLLQFANSKHITLPQLALAWLLHQGDYIVPIPGTKQIKYLTENNQADTIKLNSDDLATIKNILDSNATAGNRYTDYAMQAFNMEK